MKLWVLGSGSRGNAVLLECDGSRVLVDAGFPPRVLAQRLGAIGVPCESVEAVVITHDHADHVRGASAAAKRWGWALYATAGTVAACPALADADTRSFEPGGCLTLSRMDIRTVGIPHDAAEPVAVVATAHGSGVRAAIAYDLGHVPASVRGALIRADLLVMEANHDEGMLRAGPYPPSVQHRIGGTRGHLSNRAAAGAVREALHRDLAHVVLAHLSDRCNDAALAHHAVASGLRGNRFRGTLHVSPQDAIIGPFTPWARRAPAARQLELF